jgi:hypothetical protein
VLVAKSEICPASWKMTAVVAPAALISAVSHQLGKVWKSSECINRSLGEYGKDPFEGA